MASHTRAGEEGIGPNPLVPNRLSTHGYLCSFLACLRTRRGAARRLRVALACRSTVWTVTDPKGVLSGHRSPGHPFPQTPHLSSSILRAMSRAICLAHNQISLEKAQALGFLVNWAKSELVLTQRFVFLGDAYDLLAGLVRPSEEAVAKVLTLCRVLRRQPLQTARFLLRLLGVLNSVTDIIPYGRLHMRPLQLFLIAQWSMAPQPLSFLVNLLKNMDLQCPKYKELCPKWNLALVLAYITSPPFEPIMKASLRHLTLKTVFLPKLASGRRRNELHTLSCDEKCYRFRADGSLVTLITEPGFLAKNQKPQDSTPWIVISALGPMVGDHPDRKLCPVRVLKAYLERTKEPEGRRGSRTPSC